MFAKAINYGLILVLPCYHVTREKFKKNRRRYIKFAQLVKILIKNRIIIYITSIVKGEILITYDAIISKRLIKLTSRRLLAISLNGCGQMIVLLNSYCFA